MQTPPSSSTRSLTGQVTIGYLSSLSSHMLLKEGHIPGQGKQSLVTNRGGPVCWAAEELYPLSAPRVKAAAIVWQLLSKGPVQRA